MNDPLNHRDMVANIADTYARASQAQRESGRRWYPTAKTVVTAIAEATGMNDVRVCYALAALSPRNPWRWNVADAYSYAEARAQGRSMPRATTFKRNQLKAWQALGQDGQPWSTSAPKVTAFVAAIMGVEDAVVVDVWAYRVATTTTTKAVSTKAYRAVEAAYAEAAELAGETPRDMQAITWLVAQTEGLATHRTGRHDLTFKAGTAALVMALLS